MMKKPRNGSSVSEKISSKKPRSDSSPTRSDSPPSSPALAGGVSPFSTPPSPISPPSVYCESQSPRLVDEWGDTYVQETPSESVGDVAAGEAEAAWWSGVPSPAVVCTLSGPTPVDPAVAEEERKQMIWEEKMHRMLARMKAKADRQLADKAEAAVAVEREEMEWDDKIDRMLARMKARDSKSKALSKDAIFG